MIGSHGPVSALLSQSKRAASKTKRYLSLLLASQIFLIVEKPRVEKKKKKGN